MFQHLKEINTRPAPFEFYTAHDLWANEHTSKQMLAYHLNKEVDISSRNGAFIDRSVEWIISRLKVNATTKIADFGCGPGLYTSRLAQKQALVTGVDFSQRSIQYAQKDAARSNLQINYVNQNYLEYDTEDRFDLIMMIMCDFCALSPAQRNTMLLKFHKLLNPGGSVLLDVYSLNAFKQREETASYEANLLNGFWSPNDYYGFLNTFKYEPEKVVLDKYTIVEVDKIKTVYNWLQYFSPEDLKSEFSQCGFKNTEELYSDVAGTPFVPASSEYAIVFGK